MRASAKQADGRSKTASEHPEKQQEENQRDCNPLQHVAACWKLVPTDGTGATFRVYFHRAGWAFLFCHDAKVSEIKHSVPTGRSSTFRRSSTNIRSLRDRKVR